jgi:hypothetical protein
MDNTTSRFECNETLLRMSKQPAGNDMCMTDESIPNTLFILRSEAEDPDEETKNLVDSNSDSTGCHFVMSQSYPKSRGICMIDKARFNTPLSFRGSKSNSETEYVDSNASDSEFSDSETSKSDLDPPYAKNWVNPLSFYFFHSAAEKVSWGPAYITTTTISDVDELIPQ